MIAWSSCKLIIQLPINMQAGKFCDGNPYFKKNVIHYNCEQSIDTSPTLSQAYLKRIKSHPNIKAIALHSQETKVENMSTQRSWKKFIKPEFQSNITPQERMHKGSALEKAKKMLNKPYFERLNRPLESKILRSPIKFNKNAEVKHSINTGNNIYASSYINGHTSNTAYPRQSKFYQLNQQIRKSYVTKDSENHLTATESLALLTTRQKKSAQQQKAYKFSLLSQEGNFLRQKFLQHYARNHPIKPF